MKMNFTMARMRYNVFLFMTLAAPVVYGAEPGFFARNVAPILSAHCVSCHNNDDANGDLSFATAAKLFAGGESGPVIEAGDPDSSLLIDYISGDEPEMPQDAEPLSADQIAVIRKWIEQGAEWPQGLELRPPVVSDLNWWSLLPLRRPAVPQVSDEFADCVDNPVDQFVFAELRRHKLTPSASACRRTLIRRVYFDVIGLPPTPAEVQQFVDDPDPLAYEHLVDRLLASPHYGERWAHHWLDVVHYGDTHGYDKDKLRPNAWPYRDYVIRSFNEDKPYARFVQEQIAGDALWPDTRDGIEATGFTAAGPWDFIGHAEVPEDKLDGQVARNLDRDDMVSSTMNTFASMTVQCARCHNHKFDPITQENYYSLQAVFAALDRADREYDTDPRVAAQRIALSRRGESLAAQRELLEKRIRELAGDELAEIDNRLAELSKLAKTDPRRNLAFTATSKPSRTPKNGYKLISVRRGNLLRLCLSVVTTILTASVPDLDSQPVSRSKFRTIRILLWKLSWSLITRRWTMPIPVSHPKPLPWRAPRAVFSASRPRNWPCVRMITSLRWPS